MVMVSRTSWRCLKTPVSVTTLINGDGCPVLMPLNSWNCLQVSLKIWSHSKYGHQFGSHVESHDITVVWISWCLGWLGEFQLLFSHLVSWVMKEAPHWFQPLCDKKTTIRVSLSLLSQTCRHPYSTSLCRFPVSSQVLHLKVVDVFRFSLERT